MNSGTSQCRIETSFEAVAPLKAQWDELALRSGAPVYMTYDWLRTWWQFYGEQSALRLFLLFQDQAMIAAVPVYICGVGLPPFRIRVARLVGANTPPKIFNPPVLPEVSHQVWTEVLRHLFTVERCDTVSLGPLCREYAALDGLREALADPVAGCGMASVDQRDVHTVYEFPPTFDELFNSIDGKERKTRRKKLRDLEAKGSLRVEITREPAAVVSEFETFAHAHTAQWEAEGRPGHFHAWPRGLDYNRALVKTQGALDRVRFVRLLVGDQVVANQYNFSIGRRLYAELPARVFGPEWDRLSLGCSSQVKLLEAAIAEGYQIMESGLGHYEYKVLLGGREIPALVVRAHSSRAGTRARIRAGSTQRQLMLLFSQKLWYKRVSPLLPKSLRSGQSATAIAFDF